MKNCTDERFLEIHNSPETGIFIPKSYIILKWSNVYMVLEDWKTWCVIEMTNGKVITILKYGTFEDALKERESIMKMNWSQISKEYQDLEQ